jgi:inosine-uridine nucleoside N-ribohydrolase
MDKVLLFLFTISFSGCLADIFHKDSDPLLVIFETDMGNDIDDALALDMLYKYKDQGKIKLLAICSNNDTKFSAGFIDIMNTWYGHPNIPIGRVVDGVAYNHRRSKDYSKFVYESLEDGAFKYKRTLNELDVLPNAVELYRMILSQQPDHSVIIISVGFSTNLGRLLDTDGDKYSPLSGKKLVEEKVKFLSVMAGSFGDNPIKEFNVIMDIENSKKLFDYWPTNIVVIPYEIGAEVKYPAQSILQDFDWAVDHPLVEAYKVYRKMPYDRPTWDLLAVLIAIDPQPEFYSLSTTGKVSIDDSGFSSFVGCEECKHTYITAIPEQVENIKGYFIKLITQKPGIYVNQ